jgi:thiamine-phosphate pyrophosphorylase
VSLQVTFPIVYAITTGTTTAKTNPEDPDFTNVLRFVEAAAAAEVSLVQIREKALTARVLYELTTRAANITRGTATRLLVNDRFDVARAAGADGVHLTSSSLPADLVREICGEDFVIGVSTHSLEEARAASKADVVVFGPVFATGSKQPQGLEKLREVTTALQGFPVVAIGGINVDNAEECFRAGASGIAAIRLFATTD